MTKHIGVYKLILEVPLMLWKLSTYFDCCIEISSDFEMDEERLLWYIYLAIIFYTNAKLYLCVYL